MKIITNNQPRPLLDWCNLTEKEQQEFDWLETEEEQCSATFFRYKGQVYCLDEFVRTDHTGELSDWDGIHSETFWSGVIVKSVPYFDNEIIVGRYYS